MLLDEHTGNLRGALLTKSYLNGFMDVFSDKVLTLATMEAIELGDINLFELKFLVVLHLIIKLREPFLS